MILAPIGAVLALIFVFYKGSKILKMDEGNKEVKGIGKKIRVGANGYGFYCVWYVYFDLAYFLRKLYIENRLASIVRY